MHVIQLAQATASVCAWAILKPHSGLGRLAWPGWLAVSTLRPLAATEAKASQVSQGGTYKWPDLAEQFSN
jgi:hypothetical protein